MHSSWILGTFLRVLKFLQIKEGKLNFWGKPTLQKVWIIWCPFLHFNFKRFIDTNSSSFIIRYQCILHDSEVLFSEAWNFYKLCRSDLIIGGNHFAQSLNFGPPFCILILKVLWTQILRHLLDFNVFLMNL